jgi:hypothetical protein
MSDVYRRARHDSILRAEIAEVFHIFSKAATAEDVAFAIARSVCNLTRARSVVYVAALEGVNKESPVVVGTYGSSSMFLDYEYWRATAEQGMTHGTFKSVAESFGWNDLETEFVFESRERISEGSKLYCKKIIDAYGIFVGYLCIESEFDPFGYSDFEGALLVMSIGALRFFQAQGQFGSHAIILQKIIHDVNGALSVVGLQAELLKLKSNIENHFVEAQERIKSALKKADASVRMLNEFSHLFYPESTNRRDDLSVSLPAIALSAAFSSLTLTPVQISKIHLNNTIPSFERVHVQGVVLYWIYRALLNAWVHPFLGSESELQEVFVDLKKTDGNPNSVDLVISREIGLKRDFWLDLDQAPQFGVISEQVTLIPPVVILDKTIKLFGGFFTTEKTESARSMTIGFPCYED